MKWHVLAARLLAVPPVALRIAAPVVRWLPVVFVVALAIAPDEVLKQCESLLRPQHQVPR